MTTAKCTIPPAGWQCSRTPGHSGPCAATPTDDRDLLEAMKAEDNSPLSVGGLPLRFAASDGVPMKTGYYWAKWKIPTDGTRDGKELCPSDTWEIVQVNENVLGGADKPEENISLSVAVPGVETGQFRDGFVWGDFVAPLRD